MVEIPDYVKQEAKKELARRYLWDYCQLRYPKLYKDDRLFLKELTDRIQSFIEQNTKRFLVVNLPPRHFKSLTGTNAVEWLFGQDPSNKVMTGSYNETLSATFARKVRDTIDEKPSMGIEVYNDIFPNTKVKYGQASKSLWALEGSQEDNYLATSPTGTAIGFGANYIILDDIIKSAAEAYNQRVLESHIDWFTNTILSRTEGDSWKVIAIMTRWAKGDLAGYIIEKYKDLVEVITFKALQDDGTMLCDGVLNKSDYILKTQEMNPDVVEANYNQSPVDVKGRLYESFMTWDTLPEKAENAKIWNYTDTADKGTDFLCSINWLENDGDVYILDLVFTDEPMEMTEPAVARLLHDGKVNEAIIESNNGGRGFGRNVRRILKEDYSKSSTVITDFNQRNNKEARILSSSAWVQKHVYMPLNWSGKYPKFFNHLISYQKKGKNEHDDGPDVIAAIYERVTNSLSFDDMFDF